MLGELHVQYTCQHFFPYTFVLASFPGSCGGGTESLARWLPWSTHAPCNKLYIYVATSCSGCVKSETSICVPITPHSNTGPPQPLTKPSDVQDPNVVVGALEGEALVDPFNDVAEELSVEGLCQSIPGTGRLVRLQGDTGRWGENGEGSRSEEEVWKHKKIILLFQY